MEFNPMHWAYGLGLGVFYHNDSPPSITHMRQECWDAKALRHYELGRKGFRAIDEIHRVHMERY